MTPEPWERQKGESGKAYEAFCLYRDMGAGRCQRLVCEELAKSRAVISRWAADWNWRERTEAWDSVPVRAVKEAYEDVAREIAAQHRDVATKLMSKLSRNVDLLPDGQDPTMRFSAALGAARQSHQFATELGKPQQGSRAEITKAIEDLVRKLAGPEE